MQLKFDLALGLVTVVFFKKKQKACTGSLMRAMLIFLLDFAWLPEMAGEVQVLVGTEQSDSDPTRKPPPTVSVGRAQPLSPAQHKHRAGGQVSFLFPPRHNNLPQSHVSRARRQEGTEGTQV